MKRIIFCKFFKKKSYGQNFQCYPGELGKKIYNEISQIAWEKWLSEQTKLINENKLNMLNKNDRQILEKKMELFLFPK